MAYQQSSPILVIAGGTGLRSITAYNLIIGNGTGTPALVAPSATSGIALVSNGSAANPHYSTVVVAGGGTGAVSLTGILTGNGTSAFTASAVSQYYTLVAGASNAVSGVAPSATAGIPLVSGGSAANPSYTTAVVAGGGTGAITFTAYAPVIAGTTSTSAFQSASTGLSTSGYVLTSNGSSAVPSFQAIPAASPVLPVTYVNFAASPYTVLSGDVYLQVDVTGGPITINLPDSPATGRYYTIKDSVGLAATSNITVTTVSGTDTIDGVTSFVMNTGYQSINVIFDSANYEIY
jgi:hypothetical protein